MTTLVHASAVAIGGRAVLLIGPSGAGKSDLALRLIDRGGVLVSDDQVILEGKGGLWASAPATIAGRIEIRGIGIAALPHIDRAPVALVIDLVQTPERMPEARTTMLCGHSFPLLALAPFEASAAIKVERALLAFGLPA